jgi:hypothetical protein
MGFIVQQTDIDLLIDKIKLQIPDLINQGIYLYNVGAYNESDKIYNHANFLYLGLKFFTGLYSFSGDDEVKSLFDCLSDISDLYNVSPTVKSNLLLPQEYDFYLTTNSQSITLDFTTTTQNLSVRYDGQIQSFSIGTGPISINLPNANLRRLDFEFDDISLVTEIVANDNFIIGTLDLSNFIGLVNADFSNNKIDYIDFGLTLNTDNYTVDLTNNAYTTTKLEVQVQDIDKKSLSGFSGRQFDFTDNAFANSRTNTISSSLLSLKSITTIIEQIPPSSITLAIFIKSNSIELTWNNPYGTDAVQWEIKRKVEGGDFITAGYANGDAVMFTDDDVNIENIYTYKLVAYVRSGSEVCCTESDSASAEFPAIPVMIIEDTFIVR